MSNQERSAEKMGYIRFELQIAATGDCLEELDNLDTAIERAGAAIEEDKSASEYDQGYYEIHAIFTDKQGEQNSERIWSEADGEFVINF